MALKPASLQWSPDGSIKSADYGDVYFQMGRGPDESYYVFIDGNGLPDRFQKMDGGTFHIAELGFGSGLNFLLAAELFLRTAPEEARLFYVSVEKHPILKNDLERLYAFWPQFSSLAAEILSQYPLLTEGFHHLRLAGGRIRLMLCFGDVADALPQIDGKFDAWFLDGFTRKKNPAMWAENLFPLIAERTKKGGTLSTFTAVGDVRRTLSANGFKVKRVKGYAYKYHMTKAWMEGVEESAPKKNIAILGAGIAGCAAARALAERGHRVTLFDRNTDVAAETSGNPAAVLYPKLTVDPSPMGKFHAHAFCFAASWLKRLNVPSWNACGVLHLNVDTEDAARHRNIIERNDYPEDFARLQDDGFFQPSAGFLDPAEFCRALADHPLIRRKFEEEIKSLPKGFDAVIIALGHGSKSFAETSWLPLQPLRGQVTQLRPTEKSKSLGHAICHDGYLTPVLNGLHCTGATFQKEKAAMPETRAEDDAHNLAQLQKFLPGMGFSEKDIAASRAGYRATTPDKLPLAGRCPDYEAFLENFGDVRQGADPAGEKPYHPGLYISSGFGAHGMTGAPLAAEIIAAEISGDTCPVPKDLAAYLLPERFILRDLKRKKI